MGIDHTELAGVELRIDLEDPTFESVEIDRYSFKKIMELNQYGGLSQSDFGSGFMIPEDEEVEKNIKEDGIYLKLPSDWVLNSLTKTERESLLDHPKGRPDKPVLTFPFTLKELKLFLDWAEGASHDFPINEGALVEVIEAQTARLAPLVDSGAQPGGKDTRHKLIPQQRIEVIQKWFNSQSKFKKDNLSPPEGKRGKPWARQACWDWLSGQGFTSEGRLFGNAKQRGSAKSKAFTEAWAEFLRAE